MLRLVVSLFVLLSLCSCRTLTVDTAADEQKIQRLTQDIVQLDPVKVNRQEAKDLASELVLYSRVLSRRYDHCGNHIFQNMMVNVGLKDRGLCYHWVEDGFSHYRKFNWQTIDFYWAVSDQGELLAEHNCLLVTAKDKAFKTGLILDPWMRSGSLLWYPVSQSNYDWQLRYRLMP